MKKQSGKMKPTSSIGLVLIVLAVLLFLNNVGFRLVGMLFHHWPIVMVAVGGYLAYSARQSEISKQRFGVLPYALIGIGLVIMLTRYGFLHFSVGSLIGPIILLAIGLHLFRPDRGSCKKGRDKENKKLEKMDAADIELRAEFSNDEGEPTKSSRSPNEEPKIDIFTVLGGGNYSSQSQQLTGGNVVCILGGAEIDIREADTAQDVIEIDVLAFMGGAEIKVPAHWQVTIKAFPFLGGVSNKTTCLANKLGVPKKHLVITGLACMGGIEVKN